MSSRQWTMMTHDIDKSEYTFFRSLQNREKICGACIQFLHASHKLGKLYKGFFVKASSKIQHQIYQHAVINNRKKKKPPVYDLISPGIGLKFGLITFCFQAQYDSFYNVKNIYIYELSLVPKMLTQDSEQYQAWTTEVSKLRKNAELAFLFLYSGAINLQIFFKALFVKNVF